MQMSTPNVEDKIANISTATVYFPGELTYAGMNVSHTAQKMSMLKVIHFPSLKLSGNFLAKKARTKHIADKSPIYPRTA